MSIKPIILLGVLAAGIIIGASGVFVYSYLEQIPYDAHPLKIEDLSAVLVGNSLYVEAVLNNTGSEPVTDIFIRDMVAGNITITQDVYGLVILSHDDVYAEYCHSAYLCSKVLAKSVGFSAGTSDSPSGGMVTDSFIKAGHLTDFVFEIRCDSTEYCGTVIGEHVGVTDTLTLVLEYTTDGAILLTDVYVIDIVHE